VLWPDTWDEFGGSCATVQRSVDEIVADLLLKLDKDHLYSKDKGEEHDAEGSGPGKKLVSLEELVKETRHPVELHNRILDMLVAGRRDTTASLLSTALFALARRLDVWARVRVEVLSLAT
jgi:hypothetical protein